MGVFLVGVSKSRLGVYSASGFGSQLEAWRREDKRLCKAPHADEDRCRHTSHTILSLGKHNPPSPKTSTLLTSDRPTMSSSIVAIAVSFVLPTKGKMYFRSYNPEYSSMLFLACTTSAFVTSLLTYESMMNSMCMGIPAGTVAQ